MAHRRNSRRYGSSARPVRRRRISSERRPSGGAMRRAGGRTRPRQQTVKIQLQIAAPPIGGTGLPSEQVAEVKTTKAKF